MVIPFVTYINILSIIQVTLASPSKAKPKPLVENLRFGHDFTDHMLRIQWNDIDGWKQPKITPLTHIQMHPASKVLHYAQELYEGMKVSKIAVKRKFKII